MLPTAEIRWFIRGEIPGQVMEWFNGFDDAAITMPARTDHYLRLPDAGIGIKIREGLLEHKQRSDGEVERLRKRERERWSDRVRELWRDGENSGIIERWEKLSFPIDDAGAVQDTIENFGESWIGVEKRRNLRILELDKNRNLHSTTFEKVQGTACGWELTTLKIFGADEKWWTMGFEAFGDELNLTETLVKVCNLVLSNSPFRFAAQNSMSYPEWFYAL